MKARVRKNVLALVSNKTYRYYITAEMEKLIGKVIELKKEATGEYTTKNTIGGKWWWDAEWLDFTATDYINEEEVVDV
jgi:hypothetical protein